MPHTIAVKSLGDHAGRGEDDPIRSIRLQRDGWTQKHPGKHRENKFGAKVWIEYVEKEVWARPYGKLTLELLIAGVKERDGPWYVIEHRVVDERGAIVLDLGRSDWADWSRAGDLLFARQGSLFRVRVDKRNGLDRPEQLIELGSLKFEPVAAPAEAMKWGRQPISGRLLPAYRLS